MKKFVKRTAAVMLALWAAAASLYMAVAAGLDLQAWWNGIGLEILMYLWENRILVSRSFETLGLVFVGAAFVMMLTLLRRKRY